ncbi:carbon storage regulator [Gallibacterium anatis]|uniref:Carbon storage regulator n=1 Tax=Gallibacterium anatis TaxID=750 RepID=A0A930Y584_9PAST|nr:carbon storage regulator [Gallibacterium anatis]
MLILTRKVDEKLLIGDDIAISVLEIQTKSKWRKIPKDVAIYREEIYHKVKRDTR